MAIDIRGLGNEATLSQIAKLAYGSGRTEKESGGNGNIGILDGRVVKFNTHWGERGGNVSAEMRASCDALRTKLSTIAAVMLATRDDADAATNAKLQRTLASVRAKLGMAPDGTAVATTRLLDRKVVASVLNTIQEATGFDAWDELRQGDPTTLSSRGVDTAFERVRLDTCLALEVRNVVAEIAHPADGKQGATLNAEATDFLVGVIQRDIAARRADGKRVPTLDAILGGIRDFTSPYLNVTLQIFNLDAVCLRSDRKILERMCFGSPYLAGSSDDQRADRADVAVSFLSDFGPKDKGYAMSLSMALVSEKMPEMRRLQPQGRLTGATVWRACFGEEPPANVVRSWGTRAYLAAFTDRLDQIVTPLCERYGNDVSRDMDIDSIDSLTGAIAANGMAFTPMLHQALKVPGFTVDFDRDYVAGPPLYALADLENKTDADLESQLEDDIIRQYPLITFQDGDRREEIDFRPFNGNVAGAQAAVPGLMAQASAFFRAGERAFNGLPAGITPIQRKVMLIGLSQAAFVPFMALLGVGGEHAQARIDIRRDGNALVMTYSTMEDSPIEVRYSYRIEADGSNRRVGEFFSRLRQRPQAAQAPQAAVEG